MKFLTKVSTEIGKIMILTSAVVYYAVPGAFSL